MMPAAVPTILVPDWDTIIARCEVDGFAEYAFTTRQAEVLRVNLYRKGWRVKLRAVEGGYRLTLNGKRE
jgi:hypothetical protein